MLVKITGDGGLDRLISRLESFTGESSSLVQGKLVDSMELRTVPMAKALVPIRTGELRDSIGVEAGEAPMTANLYADRIPGIWMELGEAPHTIEASSRKALKWADAFGPLGHFAKKVEHPGIEPGKYAFLAPAVEETGEDVLQDVVDFIVATLEGLTSGVGVT